MIGSLYARLIGAGLLLVALAALWGWGHHVGAAAVQARWDAAKAEQAVVAAKASESARATEQAQSLDFAGIAGTYLQATSHAYPSLADALPAAVASGAVQLRDDCPATGGGMSEATARARAADAAATQALADRVAHSIAAVRAGDAADAREHQLDAQVIALQDLLRAERKPGAGDRSGH